MTAIRTAVRRLMDAANHGHSPEVFVRRSDLELLLATFFEKREEALRK